MKSEKKYYKKLNIVRDIACILVLLYHLNIVKGGFLAVCTFFTLSGYLSCMSAIKNKYFSIKEYYINRIKKLYLPLIIVVFITVILSKIISNINWINLKPETLSVVLGYNNFWQLKANLDYFTRNVNSPFIHLWYISILLQFDLVFPVVVSAIKKANRKGENYSSVVLISLFTIITTALFIYMSKTQNIMVVYYNTFARSFSIFFGILLGLIHYKCNFKISNILERFNTYIFIIYCLALILICIFMSAETDNYCFYMILTTIITTRLIEYSTTEENNSKFNKMINSLSNISYEVYLVQYPIIFFMQNAPINYGLKVFLIFILTFIFAVTLNSLKKKSSNSIILKSIKTIFIIVTIAFGSFIVITEKNYSAEMKDLENRLNENLKIIEEKNKEFLNTEEQNNKNELEEKSDKENEKEENANEENAKKENKIQNEESSNNNIDNNNKDSNQVAEKQDIDIDEKIKKMQIVGVGDSVMLDAIKEFYKQFPKGYFDGKISRSISGAEDVLKNLKNKGKLGNIVILSLATNGDYSDKKNKKLMELLGDREVYWIDSAGPDDPKFNEKFEKFAENYPNIHIVGWKKFAKEHPEYLEPDKIHPNYKGGKVLVNLIYEAIYKNISNTN